MESRTVVLVHGAWHGAWCWAALQAELDRRGVPSLAIDLPGHGVSNEPLSDLHGDALCVARVLDRLADAGAARPVLVGHSYGGAVITEATHRSPAAHHLVYVAAFALEAGESVMDALGSFPRHDVGLAAAMIARPDGTSVLDPVAAADALYSRCDRATVAASLARLSPQPMATVTQPTTGNGRRAIPSTYLLCTLDDSVHPEHQRIMARRCDLTVVLETDHSPFASRTEETADLLERLARS
jgi:pimeloyl-ACP methyl ester carboxylesterase